MIYRRISWLLCVLLLGMLACGSGGCGARWKPTATKKIFKPEPSAKQPDFVPYLRAFRLGNWVYERRAVQAPKETPATQRYLRASSVNRTMEGNLIGRKFLPLADYLHTGPRGKTAPAEQRQSMPPLKGGTAFLFELATPLEPIPANLKQGEPITSTTPLLYYDYDGKPLSPGTLTRKVELEGFEDIDTPAGRFAQCARVRIDLEVRVSWVLHMSLSNELWISAQRGEVRRRQHMSGRFVIFLFSSKYQYDLVAGQAMLDGPQPKEIAPKWKYGAVLLDRVVPRPRLAGMVVDYAEHVTELPTTSPATAPAATRPSSEPRQVGKVNQLLRLPNRLLPLKPTATSRAAN